MTINMSYISEHVQMYHPCLNDLTSLYHTHQSLEFAPLASLSPLHLQKIFFCLGHFQCLPKYYSNQSRRNCLSSFTTPIPVMVQNKMAKTSISFQKSKVIQGTKPAGKFWYDLLKSIFITVKIIRSSSDHSVLSLIYINYKSFPAVDTD